MLIQLALTSSNVTTLYIEGEYREVDFADIQLGDPVVVLSNPLVLSGLVVPEPSTAVLLCFEITLAACARRRSPDR